jgi:type 1 glutamine amidotransferase
MNISIKSVLLLGFFGVGSTLGACGGYVNLGDPADAGAGGESDGTGGSNDTGGGAKAGTGSGAGPTTGGTAGAGESAEAGAGGDGSAATGAGGAPEPGTGGSSQAGTGGTSAEAGAGGSGATEPPPLGPRSGSFKMLAYSRTEGFLHESIQSGRAMLEAIAAEQGFEVTMTETNEEFTLEGLSRYEVVFFLNPTGDVFDPPEEQAFEEWITTRNGAFAGVHSATDTEASWAFYKELTGQYYDLHDAAGTAGEILLEDAANEFPGMAGLPNPWQRSEEWYRFNQHEVWSAKPGFTILARNAANNHPVSWIREHGNFRSFYTSMGHASEAFQEPLVKTHIAGGIMWSVRREHLFQE